MEKSVHKKLHRNIRLIYGLAFFYSFMVIVPVIVPFFMAKGLSLADIFYLQAVFATAIVVFEAPSGYFADLFGRKTALVIGSTIHGFAYLYLNFADDFTSLIIFEITAGIAVKFGFVIERRYGAVFSLLLMSLLTIAGHFGMAWAQGWSGILIGLLLFACRGLNQVILVNAMNRRIPSELLHK